MATPPDLDDVPIPALIRAARGAYARAIRARLAAEGFDDLPRNGSFVLGGIANRGRSLSELVPQLDVTKQAVSQLIDILVVRGYLERSVDAEDRRRMTVTLTERGRAAASAVRAGVDEVDARLAERLSPRGVAALRQGLAALAEIREAAERDG